MAYSLGKEKKGPLHDYSLTITLGIMFFLSWIAQGIFQWFHEAQQAQEHGQTLDWVSFLPAFGTATFENWQSEFLQLFTFVLLTSFLLHRGSPESRDGDDQVNEALNRIEKRLDQMMDSSSVLDRKDKEERNKLLDDIKTAREMFSVREAD